MKSSTPQLLPVLRPGELAVTPEFLEDVIALAMTLAERRAWQSARAVRNAVEQHFGIADRRQDARPALRLVRKAVRA